MAHYTNDVKGGARSILNFLKAAAGKTSAVEIKKHELSVTRQVSCVICWVKSQHSSLLSNNVCSLCNPKTHLMLYFFPGLFFIFFLFFAHLWWFGFGVLGLGSYIGFLRLGFSVDRVWGLWCGAFWVFWVGALYINIKE